MATILFSLFLCFNIFDVTAKHVTHDFHISRCEINYETKTGDLQIAAHIFIDDLEDALILMGKKDLYIGTTKENSNCNDVIEQYINQKFIIKSSNQTQKLSLLGKETSKDKLAVWCYLEVTGLKNITNIDVENIILTEIFNDQKNIVDFTVDKKKKHFTVFDAKKIKEIYRW